MATDNVAGIAEGTLAIKEKANRHRDVSGLSLSF
jgi:hypothetical protein